MKNQKLSLVAWYDDLIRYAEQTFGGDLIEEKVKLLLQDCEKQRLVCLIQRNELNEAKEQIKNLKKENNRLETTLRNVRETFKNEVNVKDKIKHERDALIKKLTLIQNFLLEDEKVENSGMKERILSSLNMSRLQPIAENSLTDDSLTDIIFDRTDDDLMGNHHMNSTANRISSSTLNHLNDKEYNRLHRLSREFEEEIRLQQDKNNSVRKRKSSSNNFPLSSPKKVQQDEPNSLVESDRIDDNLKETALSSIMDSRINLHKLTTVIEENSIETSSKNSSSRPESDRTGETIDQPATYQSLQRELNQYSNNQISIHDRPHQFVVKKVFRPEKCGPCGQSIGFCTSSYHCRDCRAICHMSCKERVPLPCIPYVSRANIGKQGKLVLISDFTPPNVRPCVPALIIHCCTEIEKRGLEDIGLYRISGSKKDVTDYKERILDSKKGMPNLSTIDVYVLCGIIKDFLRSMDESLITKMAWRDFVTGATIDDKRERVNYLYDLISNLHVANRHTLAYMMIHLQKIAAKPNCKMPISNLAKVFGPTIVGFSIKDPPAEQMGEENVKQIAVMEALLELDTEFWENLISSKLTAPLIRKDSLNEVINNLNRAASPKTNGFNKYSNNRMSIGSRLCGGRVAAGVLTPLKSTNLKTNTSKSSSIRPLF